MWGEADDDGPAGKMGGGMVYPVVAAAADWYPSGTVPFSKVAPPELLVLVSVPTEGVQSIVELSDW